MAKTRRERFASLLATEKSNAWQRQATEGVVCRVSKMMKIRYFLLASIGSFLLSSCATETESITTTNTDSTTKRVHTQEELKKTGQSETGAALEKVDPSIQTSGRP